MRFAPNTGILLNFTRDGGSYYTYDYTFTGKIAETGEIFVYYSSCGSGIRNTKNHIANFPTIID